MTAYVHNVGFLVTSLPVNASSPGHAAMNGRPVKGVWLGRVGGGHQHWQTCIAHHVRLARGALPGPALQIRGGWSPRMGAGCARQETGLRLFGDVEPLHHWRAKVKGTLLAHTSRTQPNRTSCWHVADPLFYGGACTDRTIPVFASTRSHHPRTSPVLRFLQV